MKKQYKKHVRIAWILLITVSIILYLVYREQFTQENIYSFLKRYHSYIFFVYVLAHIFRALVMLPSTPLIFAGLLLFPGEPIMVFCLSMLGITIASSGIYYFAKSMDFAEFFSKKEATFLKIKAKLEGEAGYWFIFLWSFFPAVPTDLICYAAGAMRIHYGKYISALVLGEAILVGVYVFAGEYIIQLLPNL